MRKMDKKMEMENRLYVAYGSNLHLKQMSYRCPTAKVVGTSVLAGMRLLFRGGHGSAVATVEPYEGGSVPVLVWAITPADEAALDRYEGFPYLYRKETVTVELNGADTEAMVYIMNENGNGGDYDYRPLNQPNAGYYTTILDGYKAAGFDINILRQATEDSVEAAVNTNPSRNEITRLRAEYPQGTRVELISMDDAYTNLFPGDRGFVTHVDDIGTVHIQWDNGSTLGAASGADEIKSVPYITDTIRKQIMEIRKMENCPNMFDTNAVQRLAYDNDFFELTLFIEEHKGLYAAFILTGKREE
jgi:gamma-glutamylcyclotransferase (GGCT)/AIG2-like uncharacterized protein YtfP